MIETMPAVRTPVVYRPESAVFWLYVLAVALGGSVLIAGTGAVIGATLHAQIALAPLWIMFIALLVWLMNRFDPFRSVRRFPQVLMAGAALGGTAAVVMSMHGNTALGAVLARYLSPATMADWNASLTAPFIEEAAKAMCVAVVLVLCTSAFHRISHALLLGMYVGFGFDIVEDLIYASRQAIENLHSDFAGAAGNLILRILTAVPAHWAYTALAAVGVLLLMPSFVGPPSWSASRRVLIALALLASASFMHFVWDSPTPDGLDIPALLVKLVINLVVFLIPIVLLLRVERRWVAERIAAGRADGSLSAVPDEVLNALLTGRSRRRQRGHARKSGGRQARTAMRRQQDEALDLVQQLGS